MVPYSRQPILPVLDYIRQSWIHFTRTHRSLASAVVDPKFKPLQDGRWPLYVLAKDCDHVTARLRSEMPAADFAKIEIRALPADRAHTSEPGLLYLPHPYVVPGGRFNEMYGWDSFFIQMGLLRDRKYHLAKDMAQNFLYQVESYGKVLNANRTYYLTRSQPPFLTQMILAVYRHTQDRHWLASSMPAIEKYYQYWVTKPHLTPETELSRYFDLGNGPAPEVLSSELDSQGRTDYDLIRQYFHEHRVADYDVHLFYDSTTGKLTDLFYKGDRSMRESGFDPSNRFGPFSVDIIHYNPVCLNVLLYVMESQSAEILKLLDRAPEAETWRKRAEMRAHTINHLMWDDAHGLYFDYHFVHRHRRIYPFLTTFYPLWAGIATKKQAAQVVHNLFLFESQGGLRTSTRHTGDQWDSPYGWAPLQWFAVEGMRRYGFETEANRVARKFLELLIHDYQHHGTLVEKYDVLRDRSDVSRGLKFGYHSNEAGFGWTNAVFTALLDGLPEADQQDLLSRTEFSAEMAPQT